MSLPVATNKKILYPIILFFALILIIFFSWRINNSSDQNQKFKFDNKMFNSNSEINGYKLSIYEDQEFLKYYFSADSLADYSDINIVLTTSPQRILPYISESGDTTYSSVGYEINNQTLTIYLQFDPDYLDNIYSRYKTNDQGIKSWTEPLFYVMLALKQIDESYSQNEQFDIAAYRDFLRKELRNTKELPIILSKTK